MRSLRPTVARAVFVLAVLTAALAASGAAAAAEPQITVTLVRWPYT